MNVSSEEERESTLNKLETSLNKIFMNVGSVFNRNAPLESDKLATTKSRIHAAIPGAVNDLNDALDTLEGDLVHARAVLSMDLRALQATDTKSATTVGLEANAQQAGTSLTSQSRASLHGASSDPQMKIEDSSSPDITIIDFPKSANTPCQPSREPLKIEESAANPILDLRKTESDAANAESKSPKSTANNNPRGPTKDAVPDVSETAKASTQATAEPGPQKPTADATQDVAMDDAGKDELAEPSPGVSSLLPGLDMYANDPNGDAMGGIDTFNELNGSADFNMGNAADTVGDPFGTGEDMNQFSGDFNVDDLISFDANNTSEEGGQGGNAQGGLDAFDDDFFKM